MKGSSAKAKECLMKIENCQRFTFARSTLLRISQWNDLSSLTETVHTRQCNHGGEMRCGGEQWNIAAGMLQTTPSLWVRNAPQLKGVYECYMVFMNLSKTHISPGVSPANPPETAEVEWRPVAEGYHVNVIPHPQVTTDITKLITN